MNRFAEIRMNFRKPEISFRYVKHNSSALAYATFAWKGICIEGIRVFRVKENHIGCSVGPHLGPPGNREVESLVLKKYLEVRGQV